MISHDDHDDQVDPVAVRIRRLAPSARADGS